LARSARLLPLRGIIRSAGTGRKHALQVLEVGCEQRGRNAQSSHRLLAKGIKEKGGIRTQYSHVIDILPTTLDLVGVQAPEEIRGIKQQPSKDILAYSIDDAKAPTRHTVQYYYIFGRGRSMTMGGKRNSPIPTALSPELRRPRLMKMLGTLQPE